MVFVFNLLAYLTKHNALRSIHAVAKGRSSFFLSAE